MNFKNTIIGTIVTAIGTGIGYFAYFIVTMFYTVSLWVSNYLGTPEALAFIITLALIIIFGGLLVVLILVSIYVIILGVLIISTPNN